jgi:antitoxin (DNA-binding transcriptional repressor) of toxin-antitoxin stability system
LQNLEEIDFSGKIFVEEIYQMTQITLQNAEKSWTEILRKALEGEETIIERDGKPVAKVSPVKADEDWFGMDDGKGWIADDFDDTPEEFLEIIN